MKSMVPRLLGIVVVLVLAAYGYVELSPGSGDPTPAGASTVETAQPAPPPAAGSRNEPSRQAPGDGVRRVVENAAIKNYGEVIYRGPVDLTATIARIRAGERHSHRNDGSVFGNREGLLPNKPRGYYREYVHPTDGIGGPGPQRLVVGRDGDWWYTPDHYASFIELGRERRP